MRKIAIIYEDNHLLVVEKPVNVATQADASGDMDLLSILKEDIKSRYDKPGNVYLGLVHRLDRPVGGAMVFAKTSKAASRLSDSIRKREMKKEYLAVVHGSLKPDKGILKDYLYKDQKTNMVTVVPSSHKEGKEAILEYEVLESSGKYSLVAVNLVTGRPHQVRVQLANKGNPLYGDQKYGGKLSEVGQQLALWSHRITVSHPTLKEEMTFTSYPAEFHPWKLFKYISKR